MSQQRCTTGSVWHKYVQMRFCTTGLLYCLHFCSIISNMVIDLRCDFNHTPLNLWTPHSSWLPLCCWYVMTSRTSLLCTASEAWTGTCLDWLKNFALLKPREGLCDNNSVIMWWRPRNPLLLCVNVCVYAISSGQERQGTAIIKENMLIIAMSCSTAELYVFVKAVCRIRNESEALKLGIMRRQTGLLTETKGAWEVSPLAVWM